MTVHNDIQWFYSIVNLISLRAKQALSYLTVSEREIFEQTCLEWDSVSYQDYWYTWISCRVRHRLSFILIEWWLWIRTLMLQSSSSSISTRGLCLSNILDRVSLFVDDEKNKQKKKSKRERQRDYFWCHAWHVIKSKCRADFFPGKEKSVFFVNFKYSCLLAPHVPPAAIPAEEQTSSSLSRLWIVYTWFMCSIKMYCVVNAFPTLLTDRLM